LKCLVRIRGVKFHTHPNGKCLQRLSKILISLENFDFLLFLASDSDKSTIPIKKVDDPIRTRAKYFFLKNISSNFNK
jgi:hypothetical protein